MERQSTNRNNRQPYFEQTIHKFFNVLSRAFGKKKPKPSFESRLRMHRSLNPIRKNPDITNPLANQELSTLSGKNKLYDYTNLLDVDDAIIDLHALSDQNRQKLEKYIDAESDHFEIYVEKMNKLGNDDVETVLKLDRINDKKSSSTEHEYYTSLILKYDEKINQLVITSFYPSDAVLRGYSIGRLILRKIEKVAKVFKVKHILIEKPTQDAIPFYVKCGYMPDSLDKTMLVKDL